MLVRRFLTTLGVVLISCFGAGAQYVPSLINYQGRLTDQIGAALPQGSYSIQFRLWDSATSTNAADLIWAQQQTVTIQSNGSFNVILGAPGGIALAAMTNDLASAFISSNCFLGLTVASNTTGIVTNTSEILPRQQILSVPYAIHAMAADTFLNGYVPKGAILLWSGSTNDIPSGWALCDGTLSTPDLRGRFVVGSGGAYSAGATGGSSTHNHGGATQGHTLTIAEIPPHSHTYSSYDSGYNVPSFPDGQALSPITAQTSTVGGGQPHMHPIQDATNLPPYYALAYIMKL